MSKNHFIANTPRVYIDIKTLEKVCTDYLQALIDEAAKTGRIDAKLTVMESLDLQNTIVWTPATKEAIAEAVAHGYPESMGAVAFVFVYKRYSDGITTDDLRAIRAVVIQENKQVGFSELCKDNRLYGCLNAFYLGVIGAQHFLTDNNLYNSYASMNAKESGIKLSIDNQKVVANVVSGKDLPVLRSADRNAPEFNFFG